MGTASEGERRLGSCGGTNKEKSQEKRHCLILPLDSGASLWSIASLALDHAWQGRTVPECWFVREAREDTTSVYGYITSSITIGFNVLTLNFCPRTRNPNGCILCAFACRCSTVMRRGPRSGEMTGLHHFIKASSSTPTFPVIW